MGSPSKKEHVKVSLIITFCGGAGSGACSTLLFQPFDVVKTRMQEQSISHQHQKKLKMVSTFKFLVNNEGLTSLWSGLSPSLCRCVPGVALYFTTLEAMKSTYFNYNQHLGPLPALGMGATARSFTSSILMPFTIIKTRFESGSFKYASLISALSAIHNTEGFTGLFTGLGATLARDVPFSAFYFAAYTQLKSLIKNDAVGNDFICGIAAGIFASLVTHPADVVKTNMQLLLPRLRTNNADVVRFIYSSRGISGFFDGLVPRLLRRTMVSALSWTVYEQVVRYLISY